MTDPHTEAPTLDRHPILETIAAAWSHMVSWQTRADHLIQQATGSDPRRRDTEPGCPLCGHHLGARHQRAARDVRGSGGRIRRIPGELLTWRVCGGCGRYQVGERVQEVAW